MNIPDGVIKTKSIDNILFFKLTADEVPHILYSITVTTGMKLTVSQSGVKLKDSWVQSICTVPLNTTNQDIIDDVIEKLNSSLAFVNCTNLTFIFCILRIDS